jgi:hypothetical protein
MRWLEVLMGDSEAGAQLSPPPQAQCTGVLAQLSPPPPPRRSPSATASPPTPVLQRHDSS